MALQLEYIENLLLFQSSKRIKELGAQTVNKLKRGQMIISINTNTVYVKNSSDKLLLHKVNTNQSAEMMGGKILAVKTSCVAGDAF